VIVDRQIDNFLFDLDGTISLPEKGITECLNYALLELEGKSYPTEFLKKYIGPPLKEIFSRLLDSQSSQSVQRAVELYVQCYRKSGWRKNILLPGIKEILSKIQSSGKKVFLCTTKSTLIASRIINHFKLTNFFTEIYGCDNQIDKNNLVNRIVINHCLLSENTAIIGDRLSDIVAGHLNNLYTIGVTWGYGNKKELTEAGADLIIDSPLSLIPIIGNNK
jgi:phosphoglycolate phosphatase